MDDPFTDACVLPDTVHLRVIAVDPSGWVLSWPPLLPRTKQTLIGRLLLAGTETWRLWRTSLPSER